MKMAQKPDNRVHLFRLQIIIIDGSLLVLRNIIDQTLTALGVTLSACLNNEKATITLLKRHGVITQVQHDLLFPTDGQTPTTSEMDFKLIICLLRYLKCFGLNKKFDWNTKPISTDLTIKADICRLKAYRSEICHLPTTTEIQPHDFVTWWNDIEQILVRRSSSALNIQQAIADFKTCPLDPEEEKRLTEEVKRVKDYEAVYNRLNEEMKKLQTDTIEAIKKVKAIILTDMKKTREAMEKRQEKCNECVSPIQTEEDKYQNRKKEGLEMTESSNIDMHIGRQVINRNHDALKKYVGREVIEGNCVALKKYMHPDPVIDCKTIFVLLTDTDRNSIKGKDLTDKNETILRKVISKGANGYTDFKDRLRNTKQIELLELIVCAENGQDTAEIEELLWGIATLHPRYIMHTREGQEMAESSNIEMHIGRQVINRNHDAPKKYVGREVIERTFDALKKYMHPDPVIACKTNFVLLTDTDKNNIKSNDLTDKNHTILRKVKSKGAKGYTDFKERLKKTRQTELLELINCAENGQDTKEIENRLAVLWYIKHKQENQLN